VQLSRERRRECGSGENRKRKVINHVKEDEKLQRLNIADPASREVFAAQVARLARDEPKTAQQF